MILRLVRWNESKWHVLYPFRLTYCKLHVPFPEHVKYYAEWEKGQWNDKFRKTSCHICRRLMNNQNFAGNLSPAGQSHQR
jgi:hypothetical protein